MRCTDRRTCSIDVLPGIRHRHIVNHADGLMFHLQPELSCLAEVGCHTWQLLASIAQALGIHLKIPEFLHRNRNPAPFLPLYSEVLHRKFLSPCLPLLEQSHLNDQQPLVGILPCPLQVIDVVAIAGFGDRSIL